MVQKKLPTINSAHGSDTRNIINELIKLFNGMGYTYDEALSKAHSVLNEAKKTNDMNVDVQKQINNVIVGVADADSEVAQARGSHDLLHGRMQEFETSIYDMGINASVFGAKGDGVTDDTEDLQMLIDNSGGRKINLRTNGKYVISSKLETEPGVWIEGNGATIITNMMDSAIVYKPDMKIKNLRFESALDDYDAGFIEIDDKSGFSVANKSFLENLDFTGGANYKSIAFVANDVGKRGVICYIFGKNLTFNRMNSAFKMSNSHTSSWYNGNVFSQLRFYDCKNFIVMRGICDGNEFTGAQIQTTSRTENGIICEGQNNKFDIKNWDYSHYPNAIPFDFSGGSSNVVNIPSPVANYIDILGGDPSNLINYNESNGLVFTTPKQASTYKTKNGTIMQEMGNYIGEQDNVLNYADKIYSITYTGAKSTEGEVYPFRNNHLNAICELTANQEMTIEIDASAKSLEYLKVLGLSFSHNLIPEYVRIETSDGNTTIKRLEINNNKKPVVYLSGGNINNVQKVMISLSHSTDKQIRIGRIFASSGHNPQRTFLETGGSDVYGDLVFHEGSLVITSPGGSKFRLNVANDGSLSTTEI